MNIRPVGLSIICPVYKAEGCLKELYRRLKETLDVIDEEYEIVFVEDRGPDGSWKILKDICASDPVVRAVRLSRNFGQHAAIAAGLHEAKGDYVIVMDCDLQDDPKDAVRLFKKAKEGFDIVYGRRVVRQHSWFKNITAALWCRVMNVLCPERIADPALSGFSCLKRTVVDALCAIQKSGGHYLANLRSVGFSSTSIEVTHNERYSGKSSYSLLQLCAHAIDGIVTHSTRLLHLSIIIGGLNILVATAMSVNVMYGYLTQGCLPGWPSVVMLISWSTGCILSSLGIIGLYVARLCEQTGKSSRFIIDERFNGYALASEKAEERIPDYLVRLAKQPVNRSINKKTVSSIPCEV